jgi:hypothetical protein
MKCLIPSLQMGFTILLTMTILIGCSSAASFPITSTPFLSPISTTTNYLLPTRRPEKSPSANPSRIPFTPRRTPEPVGCKEPLSDYKIVTVNGYLLNQRTLDMLKYAATLYHGEIDIAMDAITQGSFHDNGAASFGTHLGGGAIDLSVMRPGTYTILYDDIEPLIQALRTAGFAAWLRKSNEIYPGSAIHIHAIAVGDKQLSEPAVQQLIGATGYFRGGTGLPESTSKPSPDRHGGPIICNWMINLGYKDMHPPNHFLP